MINERHIRGEPNTGYENSRNLGSFSCENCRYYHPLLGDMGSCDQTEMMVYSRQPRIENSREVLVDAHGCCEYVDRVGKVESTPDILSAFDEDSAIRRG
jgi:hypothetical protein